VFLENELSPEQIAASWDQINDLDEARPFANAMEAIEVALAKATGRG
jgi:hypothetical protein